MRLTISIILLLILSGGLFAASPNPDLFGVSLPSGVLDERTAEDLQRIGAKWMLVRFTAGEGGRIDHAALNEVIERAAAYGLSVTGIIDHTSCSGDRSQWSTPAYRSRFAAAVSDIVAHHRNRVKRWVIWHEPNSGEFRLDPGVYAGLLAATYEAAKEADGDAVISTGGLVVSKSDDMGARRYLDALYAADACRNFKNKNGRNPFDIISVNFHLRDSSPSQTLAAALRESIVSVLVKHGEVWKPIWLTSAGWDVELGSDPSENEKLQADWVMELYSICAEADRGTFGKGKLVNRVFYGSYIGGGFGLRDSDGRAGPAYYAYARAATGRDLSRESAPSVKAEEPSGETASTLRYAPSSRNIYGVHLLEVGGKDIDKHVRWSRRLTGEGGYLKCFFTGITTSTKGPEPAWVELINACHHHGMIPFVRLAGRHVGRYWEKPRADAPGDYTSIAQAVKRVVEGLPRKKGVPLYVEIWNEPNLDLEWTGKADLKEYAQFFVAVSKALRSLNDPDIQILNGGLALSASSTEETIKAVPEFLYAFDVWSSHPYPQNHPPEYNIHDGTARFHEATIDGYLLETAVLEKYGRKDVKVMITETGYALGNNSYQHEGYPMIDEARRADYIMRAFRDYWSKWPEVLAVFPFEFCDASNSGVWTNFDWVYPDSGIMPDGMPTKRHLQYDYVANLAKPKDSSACISGKVMETALGTPVRGALVKCEPGGRSAQTDIFGNYMLPTLPPGSYNITVQLKDYAFDPVRPVNVAAGQNAVLDLSVRAEGKGSIAGVVTEGGTGRPVSGVRVSVEPGGAIAASGDDGGYRITGLTPGWYRVSLTKEGYAPAHREDVTVVRDADAKVDFLMGKGGLPGGRNMMTNTGFEEADNSGVGLGWNNLDGKPHPEIFGIDRSVRYSGDASQRIKAALSGNNYVWQMTEYTSIKPGTKYAVRAWAKAQGMVGSGPGAVLEISFVTNGSNQTGGGKADKSLAGDSEWELLSVDMVAPPGSQRLQVVLKAECEHGAAYFDEIYVGEIDP